MLIFVCLIIVTDCGNDDYTAINKKADDFVRPELQTEIPV